MLGMNDSNPAISPSTRANSMPSSQRPSVVSTPISSISSSLASNQARSVAPLSSSTSAARGR